MRSLNERIAQFEETKKQIQSLSDEGEDFDYSIPMELMETGSEIIKELQEDRDRFKHLWETDSAQSKEIIAELEKRLEQEGILITD